MITRQKTESMEKMKYCNPLFYAVFRHFTISEENQKLFHKFLQGAVPCFIIILPPELLLYTLDWNKKCFQHSRSSFSITKYHIYVWMVAINP